MITKKTAWTRDIALTELKRWCAVQERSHFDVRTKLIEHQIYGDALEEIIAELISEDFINELRYATAYVSGKFKINEWGRNKIKLGLNQKNISSYCAKKALSQIDEDDYNALLLKLYKQKATLIKGKTLSDKQKIMNFLLQKGFEQHLIFPLINDTNKQS
jgi:regulatory protein